jgi:hypothetical protein
MIALNSLAQKATLFPRSFFSARRCRHTQRRFVMNRLQVPCIARGLVYLAGKARDKRLIARVASKPRESFCKGERSASTNRTPEYTRGGKAGGVEILGCSLHTCNYGSSCELGVGHRVAAMCRAAEGAATNSHLLCSASCERRCGRWMGRHERAGARHVEGRHSH